MEKVTEIEKLNQISKNIRLNIIEMLHEAKSGHSGGSLGMTDVFNVLFFNAMNYDQDDSDRDRFVLSNGHICPVLYATLAEAGYIEKDELKTLRKFGSKLQGHPARSEFNLIETSTGPLGQGISVAAGIAKGLKLQGKKNKVFVSSSDGEHQEGSTWEAIMFAAKHQLNNLIVFLDRNYIQIGGNTEDILGMDPLADKLRAFNWNVIEADGHNFDEIIKAFEDAKNNEGKPTMIIFKTVLGRGVSFMENNYEWHGKAPNDEEYRKAIEDING